MEDVRNISSVFLQLIMIVSVQEYQDQGKQCLHFVKLHAPWTVISNMAVQLNLRAPIQVVPSQKAIVEAYNLCFDHLRLNLLPAGTGLPACCPRCVCPT